MIKSLYVFSDIKQNSEGPDLSINQIEFEIMLMLV